MSPMKTKVAGQQISYSEIQAGNVAKLRPMIAGGRLVWFSGVTLAPLLLQAQESKFQQDPVEHAATRLLTAIILLGIVVVLYSLVRYRGRTLGAASWGVLALGVGVLPVVTSGVGTVLVFERAERVQFCESCHLTMRAFVTDMKDPKSESLAALHYKNRYIPDNQCYVCHTSYGIFGTVQAKKEGMHDVWVYYTHTFKLPIKPRHPYPNTDCLKCHAESAKWLDTHEDFKASLFSGETSCLQCHGASNPAHNVGGGGS
jgi:cytochrome c nitrite reductase small subunit